MFIFVLSFWKIWSASKLTNIFSSSRLLHSACTTGGILPMFLILCTWQSHTFPGSLLIYALYHYSLDSNNLLCMDGSLTTIDVVLPLHRTAYLQRNTLRTDQRPQSLSTEPTLQSARTYPQSTLTTSIRFSFRSPCTSLQYWFGECCCTRLASIQFLAPDPSHLLCFAEPYNKRGISQHAFLRDSLKRTSSVSELSQSVCCSTRSRLVAQRRVY